MKRYLLFLAYALAACTPSSDTTEPPDAPDTAPAVTSTPQVDVAGEIAEAADAVGFSTDLVSPEGSWQLVFEVDRRQFFIEKLGQDDAIVRFRSKHVDPDQDAIYIALLELDCDASTATDGSFMVDYTGSGEFRSFIKEENPSSSPIEGDYMRSVHQTLCERE